MKRLLIGLGAALTAMTFIACGGTSTPSTTAAATEPTTEDTEKACPFAASDVTIAVEDTAEGAAVSFVGPESKQAELRAWGEKRAQMHGKMHGKGMHGKGMHGKMHGKGMHGKGMHGKGMHGKMHGKGMHGKKEDAAGEHNHDDAHTCSMHPEVTAHEPGTCPKCGMDLVKKTGDKSTHGKGHAHPGATAGKHAGHDHGGHGAKKPMHDMTAMKAMHAATMTSEPIDGGVRLVVRAKSPDDVAMVQAHVKKHTAMMREGKCAMHRKMKHKLKRGEPETPQATPTDKTDHSTHH